MNPQRFAPLGNLLAAANARTSADDDPEAVGVVYCKADSSLRVLYADGLVDDDGPTAVDRRLTELAELAQAFIDVEPLAVTDTEDDQ